MTRGDALALSMTELRDWLRADGRGTGGPAWHALNEINAALATYRASQVGERVRLVVRRKRGKLIVHHAGGYESEPHDTCCYVEFNLPPRTTPPTVEGEVCE